MRASVIALGVLVPPVFPASEHDVDLMALSLGQSFLGDVGFVVWF